MTIYNDQGRGDRCGGYSVWIELEVNNKTCNTKEIPDFSTGNTLLWFGKYLGSRRDFEFEKDWEQINFRVKENNTGDNFCPAYLYAFVNGDGENEVTFRSDDMYSCSTCTTYDYTTNDRNHIARKTAGSFHFELPQSGKSVDTFILFMLGIRLQSKQSFLYHQYFLTTFLSGFVQI